MLKWLGERGGLFFLVVYVRITLLSMPPVPIGSLQFMLALFPEPCHEIMDLFVLRKLMLQTCMHSHPAGLDV